MAEHEDQFAPENVDEQLDSFPPVLRGEDTRLLHDLRRIYQPHAQKNARSLENVWGRMIASKSDALPEHTQNHPISQDRVTPVLQQKRIFPMQDNTLAHTQKGNVRTKIGTAITVGFLAALVASMIFVFSLARHTNTTTTGHPGESPAPIPTQVVKNSSGLYITVETSIGNIELQKLDIKSHALLWRYNVGGLSGFNVHGDTLYLTGPGSGTDMVDNVQALNANTGKLLWNVSLKADVTGMPGMGYGMLSGPTISNDTVYVSSEDGKVFSLSAANGKLLWKYASGTPTWVSTTRYGTNGVKVKNNVVYGAFHNQLFTLNAQTGKQIWSTTTKEELLFSDPQVVGNSVYLSSYEISHHTSGASQQGYVYAYNKDDGSLHWTFQAQDWVRSAPEIADGVVYFGSHDTNVYAVQASNGKLLWKHSTSGQVFDSPLFDNGTLYVTQVGNATAATDSTVTPSMLALDAKTGNVRWEKQTGVSIYGLQNDVLYGSNFPRTMLGIDAKTGNVLWKEQHGPDLIDKMGGHSGAAPIILIVQ